MPVAMRAGLPLLKPSTPICRRLRPASRCRQKMKPKRWRECATSSLSCRNSGGEKPAHCFLEFFRFLEREQARSARSSADDRRDGPDKGVTAMTKYWKLKSARGCGRPRWPRQRSTPENLSARRAPDVKRARTNTASSDGRSSSPGTVPRTPRATRPRTAAVQLQLELVEQFELEFVVQQLVELELQSGRATPARTPRRTAFRGRGWRYRR